MKVIICGAGQVGFNIARYLSREDNDVTVIDTEPSLIERISDMIDVEDLPASLRRNERTLGAAAGSPQGVCPRRPRLIDLLANEVRKALSS